MNMYTVESAKYLQTPSHPTGPTSKQPPVGMPTGVLFLIWALAAGLIWTFYKQDDYVAAVSVLGITLGALDGFRRGIMRMAISLMGIALAFNYAPQFGMEYEHVFADKFGTTGLLNRFLAISVTGAIILVAFTVATSVVRRMLFRKPTGRVGIGNWLGLTAGMAQVALGILIFLGGLQIIVPAEQAKSVRPAADASDEVMLNYRLKQAVTTTAVMTRDSQLGPWIEEYNPFILVPELNKLDQIRKTVGVLSDPDQISKLMHHPSIVQLHERPETKQAVVALLSDPEISELLESRQGFDRATINKLLRNPAVLTIIDQPGFVEEAAKVINEATLQSL